MVPPGPENEWSSDPFEPNIRDGAIYARGSADMKGGLAAMVVALEEFVTAHPEHRGSLAVLITSDEEGRARDGTLKVVEALQARGEKIEWCVLGEPSSEQTLGDIVRIGRRGSLSGMLTVNGVQGHVAFPHLADNPIRRFAPVLAELHEIEWDQGNEFFPPTSFQVSNLNSGTGVTNVIPGTADVVFNFRYSTEVTHQQLQQRVKSVLDKYNLKHNLTWELSGKPFRTASGALVDAVNYMLSKKMIKKSPLHGQVASISVGIYNGEPVLDLDYAEDCNAETDMNIVMNEAGGFIEVQGTAEGHAFQPDELNAMLELSKKGIMHLIEKQNEALT